MVRGLVARAMNRRPPCWMSARFLSAFSRGSARGMPRLGIVVVGLGLSPVQIKLRRCEFCELLLFFNNNNNNKQKSCLLLDSTTLVRYIKLTAGVLSLPQVVMVFVFSSVLCICCTICLFCIFQFNNQFMCLQLALCSPVYISSLV